MKVLMLGGTGAIGQSIVGVLEGNFSYDVFITSRKFHKDYNNIHFIVGNANDASFIDSFKNNSFDVVVDFMNYKTEVLENNISKLLSIGNQYIFLSSARVYDNSQKIINENCSLLLDTTNDELFKNSGTYAVKKAEQERMVIKAGSSRITIIRPYKTYSSDRLQLGEYEIKHWLKRLLVGKPIVLNEQILNKKTTLTSGVDVARGIIATFLNPKAMGNIFQIVSNEHTTWEEVLELYVSVLKQHKYSPSIYLTNDTKRIDSLFEHGYQMPYDIMYDRCFDSNSILNICGGLSFCPMKKGLSDSLKNYLNSNDDKQRFELTEYDMIVDSVISEGNVTVWRLE